MWYIYDMSEEECVQQEIETNDEFESALFDPTEMAERRAARRPDVSHLADAIAITEGGKRIPLFNIGERILIERRSSFLKGNPWIDTNVYTVLGIDDDTGVVSLWNEEFKQHARSTLNDPLITFKFPSLLAPSRRASNRRKRRS